MKIGAIRSYQTNFGNNQIQNQQVVAQNQEQKVNKPDLKLPNIINPQPLAGLVAPPKPLPLPYPISNPPIGGLIAPPPVPKHPYPTVPAPVGGLITPPPKTKLPTIPTIPTVTAGLIGHPDDKRIKEHLEKIKEEIAKIEQKQ